MKRLTSSILLVLCFVLLLFSAAITPTYAQTEEEEEAVSLTEAMLRSPAVASVLDQPRDTPAQQLSAIFTLLDLGQADVAQVLWKEFSGTELDDAAKAALVKHFGVARFLILARREGADGLAGARQFAETSLQAAAQLNRNPERLAQLISQLSNQNDEVRQAARSDLAVTGDAGAHACLEALAQANDEKLRTELLLTLAKMRPGVEPLLIAALADGRGQFRRDLVELAGYLRLQDAVPWLAAIAAGADDEKTVVAAAHAALGKMGLSPPNVADARAVVLSEIQRLESHQHPATAESPWWSYDPEQKNLIARELATDQKHLLTIAQLARILSQLPNATASDRRLTLIYAYQVSQVLDQPLAADLQQWADSLNAEELSEMLHESLQGNQITAAIACCRLLGVRQGEAALLSLHGQQSSLATALLHSNGELRYAALEAVMKIRPQQAFAGSSAVPKALWSFAASAGTPQAIAASSVVSRASDWAGQLRGMGYDATPVATGRKALRTALDSPRLELILLDSDIGRPLVREVIYQLRSTQQTARVPIAVLSSLHNLPRTERLAEQDRWLLATPRPHGDEAMQEVLERLVELDTSRTSAERRTEQAAAALGWIADLLATGHPYDELLREADLINETLYQPELTAVSLRVLSVLGTANSQQTLLNYVSSTTLSIESRREAGIAFANSVERFGKLLTSEEILRQYDRYNASETADRQTQEVLGGVLDILEK